MQCLQKKVGLEQNGYARPARTLFLWVSFRLSQYKIFAFDAGTAYNILQSTGFHLQENSNPNPPLEPENFLTAKTARFKNGSHG